MANVSEIKINNRDCTIRDYRIPALTNSANTYLRGDGDWVIPATSSNNGVTFIDGGDHLFVEKINP